MGASRMLDWEGRILDNRSIMVVKAALPFLDIPVGDIVDLEGLLRAIRNFCQKKEQKFIDMILNFFMMKRVMSMMTVMNEAQNSGQGMEGVFDILKSQMPKEQQEMFDMMAMMMSAMDMGENNNSPEEDPVPDEEMSGDAEMGEDREETAGEEPIPEIWNLIAENFDKGTSE